MASLLCRAEHALLIDFADLATLDVPLPLDAAGLAILVIDTRVHHSHADGAYADRRAESERGDPRRLRHVTSENARVRQAVTAIENGDWAELGRLMTASHASLRDDYEVSAPELDTAVDAALAAGALGARMTGGGFGGSAIALVRSKAVEAVSAEVVDAFEVSGYGAPELLTAVPSAPAGPA
jgi:galactokinase